MQSFALNFVGPNAFAVAPVNIINTGAQFRFDFTPSVWSKIKVNFWASSNAQIQVGHLEAGKTFHHSDNLPIGAKSCRGCAYVNTNLVTPFGSADHPVIRVFINGYNLNKRSGALQVSVSPTNL